MKNLEGFLKKNKIQVPNVKYIASKDFVDEEGNPLEWELRKVTTREYNELRSKCMKIDVKTKDVIFDQSKFQNKLCALSVVFPNLKNTELQNSYGIVGEENLLQEMLDPFEFTNLLKKIDSILENQTFSEKVDEAKN